MGHPAELFIETNKRTISLGGGIMGYGDKKYLKKRKELEEKGEVIKRVWFENTESDLERYRQGRMSYCDLSRIDRKILEEQS